MLKKILQHLLLPILVCSFIACDTLLLGNPIPDTPTDSFQTLWRNYDELYGLFIVKNINWDSVGSVYRPLVTNKSTDSELFFAMKSLLGHLNDNHVFLLPSNSELPTYNAGLIGRLGTFKDFKLSAIVQNYCIEHHEYSNELIYGKLKNNIGYIHLNTFMMDIPTYEKTFNDLFKYFSTCNGIIFDIRNNWGGIDKMAVYIASRFANEKKLALRIRLRNGKNHSDFTPWRDYFVEPKGKTQYTKKVILLTHRFSLSAAESFTLAMKRLNTITVVGDTTAGSLSDMVVRELPNGWCYTISVGEWIDYQGICYEGVGIAPDIVIKNDSLSVVQGRDSVLEKSMHLLIH